MRVRSPPQKKRSSRSLPASWRVYGSPSSASRSAGWLATGAAGRADPRRPADRDAGGPGPL